MFSPLQVISSLSLLQSTLKIEDYVKIGKKLGYQALALTDINVMYGVLDFYHACQKYQIKPLIGLTLQLNAATEDEDSLILFAKNKRGYQNLMKISSAKMSVEGYEAGMGPILLNQIQSYASDLTVIIPEQSKITLSLKKHQYESASQALNEILKVFSKENVFLGANLQMNDDLVYSLRQMENQFHVKLVANQPVKYLTANQAFNVEVLRAIATNQKLEAQQLNSPAQGNLYLKSPVELKQKFDEAGLMDAWDEAVQMIAQINIQLDFPKTQLPHFSTPNGQTSQEYLKKLCQRGLTQRLQNKEVDLAKYQQRLNHELEVIHRMGFDDYFLIVWDVTHFSHEHDILVGPGRGSAAGSLVSYTLFITDVDPIEYGLLFERFLNEERAQMPDIDLDIPDQKRDEIIKYVHERYGQDHMAQIITYSHLSARQVIRDVSRVMGQNSYEISAWSKAMPRLHNVTLKEAYQQSQQLRNMVADSQKNALIFKTALALEGLPRQYSTHAAGVILSDHDLRDYVPLQMGSEGIYLTQFAKDQVEEVGLLKIDFLGLRNLTILENALQFIKRDYDANFDIRQISLNDPKTLNLFRTADTAGIFQFESSGIKNVLQQLKPQNFEDIVSTNALFRPGPIQNIDEFIARKNGQKQVSYPNEHLRSILKNTYGIIVYQEQVMQVASEMGGFTLGQADLLRRAMSKKKQAVIDKMRDQFIQGAIKKGYSAQDAAAVYEFIDRFGNYGFNRSHSVAYSKLAFELAYIKCHYPAAFYAALLNSVVGSAEKTRDYVTEARQKGVKVHLPNINQSQLYFILKNHEIYFGFRSIRKLRIDFIKEILTNRNENGYYRSLTDFIQRIDNKFLTEESLEPLIYSGAFDDLNKNRNQMLSQMPSLLESIKLSGGNIELLKQLMPKKEQSSINLSQSELLEKEAEYLGTYISGHPVDQYHCLAEINQTQSVNQVKKDTFVKMLLYITHVKIIRTKKQTQMAFVSASDATGKIELTFFPQQFAQFGGLLHSGEVIFVTGKIEERNEQLNLIANQIQLASQMNQQCYYLRIEKLDEAHKRQLLQIMQENHGEIPVIVYENATQRKIVMQSRFWLNNSHATVVKLNNFLGESNVVLR